MSAQQAIEIQVAGCPPPGLQPGPVERTGVQPATVAMQEVRLVLATAARAGVGSRALLAAVHLSESELADPDARVRQPVFERLLEEAIVRSRDANLGLHAGELTHDVRMPDALHYALNSCTTLGEQYRLACRYSAFVNANATLELEPDGRTTRLTHELRGATALARRHLAERVLAALTLAGRRHAGAHFAPREVWFTHPVPEDTSEHERIFRAPIRFSAPVDALVLDTAQLESPVRDADPALRRVLEDYLEGLLPQTEPEDLLEAVRCRVREGTHGRLPSIDAVAHALAMSPRTLQRKLSAQGTTYQELVTEVRKDLARQHLTDSRLSISEIAFLLGFSDVSTFHRAFKRWTQQTPSAFRRAGIRLHAG
jgi:AraC-like DNA-binding protein